MALYLVCTMVELTAQSKDYDLAYKSESEMVQQMEKYLEVTTEDDYSSVKLLLAPK